MSHYKISLEETEKVTTIEYYGKQFPVHPEEWEQYHSFWQEDYARFLLQKDIGLLTIYYAKEDLSCLWEGRFKSMHDVHQKFNASNTPYYDLITINGVVSLFEYDYAKTKQDIVNSCFLKHTESELDVREQEGLEAVMKWFNPDVGLAFAEIHPETAPILHRCPNLELRECFGLAVNPVWYRIRDTFNDAYETLFSAKERSL
ncbi:hypothetical protein DIX60_10600 [Streptococcus iniae]|uniref:hypothetical protein n=1 Tax=Streptococcus iniae TaxID=1346 RepID=UPI0002FF5657|nr:hypothetical protein [Streptococcus iniae]ESR10619.1 hypothetical protein IUSA1_00700 [Streptococcus iniae IUSA1]KYJ82812.1 hypothetical protein NA30_01795 [Streptococcus iniae]RLV26764.1 hypothetical protein DIX60_10600 [Streptococcus iniae]RMI75669.1 hypothetical protein DIX59_03895 [Streptococcus iniae]HEK4516384.1 hypothetical protein [Streptococcus iniae]